MNTGIYIRAIIEGRPESIDIGDTRLPADELLRWLTTLPDDSVLRTIDVAREAVRVTAKFNRRKP
jgi:hypothetical protein